MRDVNTCSGVISLDKKSYKAYKNILIYDISHKIFMGSIPLRIRFDKIDRFLKFMME